MVPDDPPRLPTRKDFLYLWITLIAWSALLGAAWLGGVLLLGILFPELSGLKLDIAKVAILFVIGWPVTWLYRTIATRAPFLRDRLPKPVAKDDQANK